ncbi:MAG: hypothetical protein ACLQPH_13005 [Acidimicrobiales bacterium]
MFKKTLASIVVGGTLLSGVAAAGTAYASTPPAAATAASASPSTSHPLAAWLRHHRRAVRQAVLSTSATAIGVAPTDLASELKSGKSIEQVAAEHGVATTTVTNSLESAADAELAHAVSAHKLTSTEAGAIEAALPGYAAKVVNHVF